jgi:hypothetical protein
MDILIKIKRQFEFNSCDCDYECNANRFEQNFKNWTSGNNDIDKFIQSTQLSAHEEVTDALEWIPYDRFYDIKHIAEGGFDEVYRANWTDGCISYWNYNNWERVGSNMSVILKILNNPASITSEFINKV